MRAEAFELVEVLTPEGTLPLRSRQSSPKTQTMFHLVVLALLAALCIAPQIWLALEALKSNSFRQSLVEHPGVAAELLIAFLFWTGLCAWPLMRIARRIARRRDIEITTGGVTVTETRTLGSERWHAPLNSYSGVAHRIRTTVSGARHELLLEHRLRSRSVILMVSEHIGERDVARMSQVLGVPALLRSGTRVISGAPLTVFKAEARAA